MTRLTPPASFSGETEELHEHWNAKLAAADADETSGCAGHETERHGDRDRPHGQSLIASMLDKRRTYDPRP